MSSRSSPPVSTRPSSRRSRRPRNTRRREGRRPVAVAALRRTASPLNRFGSHSGPALYWSMDDGPRLYRPRERDLPAADDARLTASLNPDQARAATFGDGPLLVIAGAGTGKTRTLIHRVAALIERGVAPERILLLTFTRRAAGEMLSRAERLVGSVGTRVHGGTFH